MSGINDHLFKVRHNLRFLNWLTLTWGRFPDWRISAQFYTALHLVDAYLATRDEHPPSHHLRGDYIGRNLELKPIYFDYQDLSNLSRDARYTNQPISRDNLRDCFVALAAIRQHIERLIGNV